MDERCALCCVLCITMVAFVLPVLIVVAGEGLFALYEKQVVREVLAHKAGNVWFI